MTLDFNKDWLFMKGEHGEDVIRVDFDDSGWQAVQLPHDWAVAGPFDPAGDGSTGKLPWKGVGWYRKRFTLDADYAGRRVYFGFDGVMAFPSVYINGQLAGEWDYGYSSFSIDATPYVKLGKTNIIAIKADTRKHRSRWYPGAGIYRKVTMTVTEPVHIAHWGTFVATPSGSNDSATVNVNVTVENHLDKDVSVDVSIMLIDPDGAQTAKGKVSILLPSGSASDAVRTLDIPNPRLWDIRTPELYRAHIIVSVAGRKVDSETVVFGIRSFRFTADDGFHLNGRRVQLKGVNLHHDQGPLGAAFNKRAMERQLEIMKEMGANALRTSHNPPAPEVLELCDRMGIIVWDEAFDKWEGTAGHVTEEPLETFGERQLKNFVMRDRNHPCVVLWSIGNEIGTGEKGWGKTADRDFYLMEKDSFVAGEFVWTGFDYLGEPSPFLNRARSSYFGIVDLCGIPKDRYYLYRSHWKPNESTTHILPHWNWPNRKGKTIPVFVYTNGDSAELFLNGRSLGKRSKMNNIPGGLKGDYYAVLDRYRLRWMDIVYEPGELRAVIYKDGAITGEAIKKTAGDPVRLVLTPDRNEISADGYDLSYVLVEAVDGEGIPCLLVNDLVTFRLDGPAEIAGIENGNPLSMEPFQDSRHSLFHGKAMLILRSIEGKSGTVTITATAEGYDTARVHVKTGE